MLKAPVSPALHNRSTMDRPLPVFSDFSHMSAAHGIGDVRFVVGLREENPDAIVSRVFPLTKVIPAVVKEKKQKAKPKRVVEEKPCVRMDCAARQEKLHSLIEANKLLRLKVQTLESSVATVLNKSTLIEKSILLAEEQSDSLNGQIEEAKTKLHSIATDIEKVEGINSGLREHLQQLLAEIESRKSKPDDNSWQQHKPAVDLSEREVVFSKDSRFRDFQLASEVSILRFPKDISDDDSD